MLIENCGRYKEVHHEYTGEEGSENRGCCVVATRIADGELVRGTTVSIQMATAEGWMSNPKWRNMPELMLAYRASAFFARVHCPEALMGVHLVEENEDVSNNSNKTQSANTLTNALKEKGE